MTDGELTEEELKRKQIELAKEKIKYRGKWVAFTTKDGIVEVGDTALEARENAAKNGYEFPVPFVDLVPDIKGIAIFPASV